MLRVLNNVGAFMSYQSFLVKGSTLQQGRTHERTKRDKSEPLENWDQLGQNERETATLGLRFLFASLPTFRDALVLTDRHGCNLVREGEGRVAARPPGRMGG